MGAPAWAGSSPSGRAPAPRALVPQLQIGREASPASELVVEFAAAQVLRPVWAQLRKSRVLQASYAWCQS